jgi:Spy/CpxP family protein refolding chaperone
MKKSIIAPALVLGALFSLLIAAGAMAQRGPGRHHGHGGHRGLMNVDRLAEYLDLTAAQKTQAEQIREKMKTAIEPLREEQRELFEAVHTALENNADATTVGTAMIAAHQHREKIRTLHEQYDAELEALLTPEQLSRWRALKEARKAMRPPFGPFGNDEPED